MDGLIRDLSPCSMVTVGSSADFSKHIAVSGPAERFSISNLKRQSESVCASGTLFHCVRLSAMILVECRAP